MRRLRSWSVRHARVLKTLYGGVERLLLGIDPLLGRIGHKRLDGPVLVLERLTKGILLDSRSCGQCIVGSTGLSCPMNCPKKIRNGPCGGVRANGKCEVEPDMDCVWVLAWEGNKRLGVREYPIQRVQPAVHHRLLNTSAWLRAVREKQGVSEVIGQ